MSYGRICLKCEGGGVTVLPLPIGFSAWVCVLRVGDSLVTLLLWAGAISGEEGVICTIVGAGDFGRGERILQ